MEEDTEVLDWGNEDDEQQLADSHRTNRGGTGSGDVEDAEDAVSLGPDDDDDDDYYAYRSRQEMSSKGLPSTPKSATYTHQQQQQQQSYSQPLQRENSSNSQLHLSTSGSPQNSPQRTQSLPKITHALPPKPTVAIVPFLHPSHPSIIEATAMSRSSGRDKQSKTNGNVAISAGKPVSVGESVSRDSPLPPDWEIRHSRSGTRGIYYYNVRTHESTWSRPISSGTDTSGVQNSGRVHTKQQYRAVPGKGAYDDQTPTKSFDQSQGISANSASFRPPVRQSQPRTEYDWSDSQMSQQPTAPDPANALTYEDRHYRPNGGDGAVDTVDVAHSASTKRERESDSRYPPQNAVTPPASPRLEQVRSYSRSPRRGREEHRQSRPYDRLSRVPSAVDLPRRRISPRQESPRAASVSRASPHWDSHVDSRHHPQEQQQHQRQNYPDQHSTDTETRLVSSISSTQKFEDRPRMRGQREREDRHGQSNGMMQSALPVSTTLASRRRSPPPQHLREQEDKHVRTSPIISLPAPPVAVPELQPNQGTGRRGKTRFDRPPIQVSKVISSPPTTDMESIDANNPFSPEPQPQLIPPREHNLYASADVNTTAPRREREHDGLERNAVPDRRDHDAELLSSAQVRLNIPRDDNLPHTSSYHRMREDQNRAPRTAVFEREEADHRSSLVGGADPYAPTQERPMSTSSPSSDVQSQSRSKRYPLPPQSSRFQQMATPQRPNNVGGPPSGPRSQPSQPIAPMSSIRDSSHPDFAHGSRLPPSGPSGSSSKDRDSNRRGSGAFTPSYDMDVDVDPRPPPSRAPTANDLPIRAGGGMYADREPAADLPKGPRAMSTKVLTPGFMGTSSPTLPTTPFTPQFTGRHGRREYTPPPPHMAENINDGWGDYSSNRGMGQGVGGPPRQGSAGWRGEEPRGRPSPGHHPMERTQGRREPHPRGRSNEFPRPPLPPPSSNFSDANAIPIRSRKGFGSGTGAAYAEPPFAPPAVRYGGPESDMGVSGGNTSHSWNAGPRPSHAKEVYERPLSFNSNIPPTGNGYRSNVRSEGLDNDNYHQNRSWSTNSMARPSEFERTAASGHPRHSNYGSLEESRFNYLPPSSRSREPPRLWTAKETLQAYGQNPSRNYTEQNEYRAVTPPSISREPPNPSQIWESSATRSRPPSRFTDDQNRKHDGGATDTEMWQQRREPLPERHRERFESLETPAAGSLERRLGERFEDRFIETRRRPHDLPPKPPQREEYGPEPPQQGRDIPNRERSNSFVADGYSGTSRVGQGRQRELPPPTRTISPHERGREFVEPVESQVLDSDVTSERPGKPPIRIRRTISTFPSGNDTGRSNLIQPPSGSSYAEEKGDNVADSSSGRPRSPIPRHGGSLLDRLSLNEVGDSLSNDVSSPTLRDRVQLPTKRDRDEFDNSMDNSFDGDDGDPAAKRLRRRNNAKSKKGRKGV